MKIVIKETAPVKFKELKGGDVFSFPENPNGILMRLNSEQGFICLENGKCSACIQPNIKVIVFPNAELHLNTEA